MLVICSSPESAKVVVLSSSSKDLMLWRRLTLWMVPVAMVSRARDFSFSIMVMIIGGSDTLVVRSMMRAMFLSYWCLMKWSWRNWVQDVGVGML